MYLRVGLLILGGLALLVGFVIFLAGNRLRDGRAYESYFKESVQGLEVGAPVKYRGVTLGRVTDIGLTSAEYGNASTTADGPGQFRLVFVRFLIDPKRVGRLPDTEGAVRTGLRARLASQGLTGLSYIELDFVDPAQYPPAAIPWTPRDEYIPSMPSTLSQVQDAAQQFLAKLNGVDIDQLATNLNGLLADLRGQLRGNDVHDLLVSVEALVKDVRDQLDAADLPATTRELRGTATSAQALLDSPQTRALVANAATAADRLAVAAARLPALIAAAQSTAQRADAGTADLTASLGPLLQDLQTTIANLRATSEALRRYPASVLLGGPPPREAR